MGGDLQNAGNLIFMGKITLDHWKYKMPKQIPRSRDKGLVGHRGRQGRSRQYQLKHGKGRVRMMATKIIHPESLTKQPSRSTTKSHTKTEIELKQEIQELKERAQNIESRLLYLDRKIGDIESGPTLALKAYVDSDICVGCGICQDACPTGAISVVEVARIDPRRCTGCGGCVEQCPRGAITLHPLNTEYKEQARSAI